MSEAEKFALYMFLTTFGLLGFAVGAIVALWSIVNLLPLHLIAGLAATILAVVLLAKAVTLLEQ